MLKINAWISFNQMFKMHHLTPSDAHINIKGGNIRVANTIQAEVKKRINQQLKYVYKKLSKCVTVSHIRAFRKHYFTTVKTP
jgi:ribosome-associated translation inhibitor RaiA